MNCFKCGQFIQSQPVYGLHPGCFEAWFGMSCQSEFRELNPQNTITKQNNTFFHGNFLKYSAWLDGVPYILKVQQEQYPELPVTEYLCNQLAEILKIEIPSHFLIEFNGRPTFVCKNFMHNYNSASLHHIYKYLPEGDQHHNCEEIITVISRETGRFLDIKSFIFICLFDALIGNNDRHGRNLAIIETSQRQILLAPMYDNSSAFGVEDKFMLGAHFNFSGLIWTFASKEPRLQEYIKEFERLGYAEVAEQFIALVISSSHQLTMAVENSFLSEKRRNAFLKFLKERIEEFENVTIIA